MSSIADELAKKQKEISVSEFFERNRQILGFDSQVKSLIMGVKEAVDNSLDACEEAGILPEILVIVERVDKDEYRVTVEDNGPGIVKKSIPNVFGRLLYGSRFHAVRQSRGQQGIGISATVMFGQITTGKPATVRLQDRHGTTWPGSMDIMINTKKNMPDVLKEDPFIWDGKEHGTRIDFYMNGRYVTGKQSVHGVPEADGHREPALHASPSSTRTGNAPPSNGPPTSCRRRPRRSSLTPKVSSWAP